MSIDFPKEEERILKRWDEINAFLTQKMEEDVKAAEGRPTKRSKKEEREEEMYGEEDPEADD